MSSLSDRIMLLEGMLKKRGVVPPPACHPPRTKHEAQNKTDGQQNAEAHTQQQLSAQPMAPDSEHSASLGVPSPPDSANGFIKLDAELIDTSMSDRNHILAGLPKEDSSPINILNSRQDDVFQRLLYAQGNLPSDRLEPLEPPEQVRRAEKIMRSLNPSTYNYLMDHFWEYYNSVIPVIDRHAFEADRESRTPKFYSSFLHIAILAMGYRGCDKERDDIKLMSLGNRESTLHREAKYMLDVELERRGGVPSVQALLLLGDLECGVGRDNTGWMYAGKLKLDIVFQVTKFANSNKIGMANRLAFDIGLHLHCGSSTMAPKEVQIRQMVMKACVVYDKYWALFLGRPTSIKSQDLGMELISENVSSTFHSGPATPASKDIGIEIYEQLIELMELSGRIVETRDQHAFKPPRNDGTNMFAMNETENNAYLHTINLNRQLQNWYRRLPNHLTWCPANIKTAPYSFFLLHQQFHATMILLHRPWARYDFIPGDGTNGSHHASPESSDTPSATEASATQIPGLGACEHSADLGAPNMTHDSRASLSRNICTQQAIRIARIFWQHRQRFDGRKIFVTGVQHAGTAVIALIAALTHQCSETDSRTYMGYLEILSSALGDMSYVYHPAGRMDDLLRAVMVQVRHGLGDASQTMARAQVFSFNGMPGMASGAGSSNLSIPAIPARRESSDVDSGYPYKRIRSSGSRRASEFARPPPPFFQTNATQPNLSHSALNTHMFGQESHHRSNSQVDSMLFSLGSAGLSNIDLDFLNESAVEMDSSEEQPIQHQHREQTNLVTPSSSDMWSYGSSHGEPQSGTQGIESGPNHYGPGPAGLSASPALGQNSVATAGFMSGTTFDVAKDQGDMVHNRNGSSVHTAMDSSNPVNMGGLVQSVERSSDGADSLGDESRNHDLDFFSFN